MTRDVLTKLVEAACLAPSVDNCQPWRFVCSEDAIALFLDRKRAEFFGDYGFAASYATIGAAIENMRIAASHLGLRTEIACFPSPDADHVATVTFSDAALTPDPLYRCLPLRCTNRRKYLKQPLSREQAETLQESADLPGTRLYLFEGEAVIKPLFRLAARIDSIIFDHESLHANLFRWLRWNGDQKLKTCDGMPVGSLELDPFQQLFFRLISSFGILKLLNAFGTNRLIGLLNSALLLNSSAVGLLVTDGSSNVDYLNGGRSMQRVWLTASALGLAAQPFGGVPFLLTRMLRAGSDGFSESQYALLRSTYRDLQQMVPIQDENGLIILFRIGTAADPSERSIRRPLADVATFTF